MDYLDYLKNKKVIHNNYGFTPKKLNRHLFNFQEHVTRWACEKGRAALFENCGMGKAIQSLAWGDAVHREIGGDILFLAPLAVAKQTKREGNKFNIRTTICNTDSDIRPGINITNYEKLHNFDPSLFVGVIADESSIIKSYTGKVRNQLIDYFSNTPYRLSCTATPSPNDYEEMGNQAEFLGICTRSEMLSMFFINDTSDTGTWRLKKHAETKFWEWVCSWAILIHHPSDIGFSCDGFDLPELNYHEHVIKTGSKHSIGFFDFRSRTLSERRKIRRDSTEDRCALAADLINKSNETWVVWCDLNVESSLLTQLIDDAVEVKGTDTDDHKAKSMMDFADNKIKCLVTKPKIGGWGMNWQNCHNMAFVGLSDSFEAMYQAVRRCYRFGQDKDVDVHIITHQLEGAVVNNIKRKEALFINMYEQMISHAQKSKTGRDLYCDIEHDVQQIKLPKWVIQS